MCPHSMHVKSQHICTHLGSTLGLVFPAQLGRSGVPTGRFGPGLLYLCNTRHSLETQLSYGEIISLARLPLSRLGWSTSQGGALARP